MRRITSVRLSVASADSACENCVYFQTTIGFRPTLQAQHDDAVSKDQTDRIQLFGRLLTDLDRDAS